MAKTTFNKGFGDLARDSNGTGAALQTATTFTTQDVSATPKSSPLAYTTAITSITVPDDGVQLVLSPSTDLRVSEDSAMMHYDIITAGAKEAFAVALMQLVYIRADTATGTVRFRFAKV